MPMPRPMPRPIFMLVLLLEEDEVLVDGVRMVPGGREVQSVVFWQQPAASGPQQKEMVLVAGLREEGHGTRGMALRVDFWACVRLACECEGAGWECGSVPLSPGQNFLHGAAQALSVHPCCVMRLFDPGLRQRPLERQTSSLLQHHVVALESVPGVEHATWFASSFPHVS